MIVRELVDRLELEVAAGTGGLDNIISGGYCGDLLSDVMGRAPEGCVWLTVQGHQNILAVAVLRGLSAIVLVGGHIPDEDTKKKADSEKIPLLLWPGSSFDLAVRLVAEGVGK